MPFPKIVSLSGVDGSGKSTAANLVKKHVEQNGQRARVAHTGALFQGPPERKQIWAGFGLVIFFKDYLQVVFEYLRSIGAYDVVIFDRFLYDSVVKITYKQGAHDISWFYRYLIPMIFPFPHIALLLLVSPADSYRRDRQHSKEYHMLKHELYKQVASYFPLIPIDAAGKIRDVIKEINAYI